MRIPDKDQFQPSQDALNYWLATRKKVKILAGKDIMPLFTDTDYENDKKWYYIALGLEFIGLLATIYGGLRSGGIFAIIAIIVVIAFMFIDFVWIAPQLHKKEGVDTLRKAKIQMLHRKNNRSEIRKLQDQINKGKAYFYFLVFLLILMAVVKTFGIILLGAFDSMIVYIAFFALFLIIVYAHVYKTRYYLAYKKTQNQIDKDYENFKNDDDEFVVKNYKSTFQTKEQLRGFDNEKKQIDVENHSLKQLISDAKENGKYTYELNVKGVLDDDELFRLASNQNNQNTIKIFKAGRKLQLESYGLGDNTSHSSKSGELDSLSMDDDLDDDMDLNNDL